MKKILIIVLPALFIYGCGVWADFTTYFNLYYNASDLFQKAEEDINSSKKDVFSIQDVPLSANTNANITKVIEKCSQILQFHANSGYVDDALLMIGKCFYYQASYQNALRKFNELLSTQPNSDLVLEANLWTGMTQIGERDFDKGLNTLKSVMDNAQKKGDKDILESAYIEEIKYTISQKDYDGAISLLDDFLKTSGNSEIKAEAAFKQGMLYKEEGDLPNAIKAFEKVNNYSPTYYILLKSSIQLGKTFRENGEFQKSLDLFNSMRAQSKFSDAFDSIEVQSGITLMQMNKLDDAINKFVLVDTTYSKTPSAGLAEYQLGNIYENNFSNFDTASYYYTKSLSHSLAKEYVDSAKNNIELLRKYKNSLTELKRINRDINYLQNPDAFLKDSLDYVEKLNKEKEEKAHDEERIKKLAYEKRFNANARNTEQAAIKIKPPQRPKISLDSLNSELIKTKFELGNLLFTEFNLPDSAIQYYKDIIQNFPNSSYQAKVLYAIGSYFLVKNDSVKADSLFNIIYNRYKNQSIVNAAANKLNKPLIQINSDPVETLYSFSEKQMDDKKYDSSLVNLYKIYENHPTSHYAAKALFAYGWILENEMNLPDSAASIYDTLSKKYPNTVYSNAIKTKLAYYQSEKEKELHPDSLNSKIDTNTAPVNNSAINLSGKAEVVNKTGETGVKEAESNGNEALKRNTQANPDTLIRVFSRFKNR